MARQPRQPSSLKIAFWNIAGLRSGRNEAEDFAQENDLDVLLVCETHLRPCDNPKIRNYTLYRADRDGRGGGTAIYVRNTVDHHTGGSCGATNIEANAVIINTSSGPLRLTSVYKSPNKPLLPADLDLLLDTGQPTILAGDLNCKHPSWSSRIANTNGRILRAFTDRQGDVVVLGPVEPTFFHPQGHRPDVLDIMVTKGLSMPVELFTVTAGSSDHNPVVALINGDTESNHSTLRQRVCWPRFSALVEDTVSCAPPLQTPDDLDLAVDSISSCISTAMEAATRSYSRPAGHNEIPADIRDLIRSKNQARRAWQRHQDPADRTRMNRLAKQVKQALYTLRNDRWSSMLESLEDEGKSPWGIARALRKKPNAMPPIHGPAGVVFSDSEKAEVFADRLELQMSPNFTNADLDHIEEVERQVDNFMANPDDNSIPKHTTPLEVRSLIDALPVKKAPGPDNIPNVALKSLGRKGTVALVNLFNCAIRLRHFPTKWREATVVMIPKSTQNRSHPQNYRPISLLSGVSKVLERLILSRLQTWLTESSLLPDEQHGFRTNHSTCHQLLRVVEQITQAFNWNQATGAIFLDVAKAFDKVWHVGLVYKLSRAGAPEWMTRIIHSFLQDRTFRVRVRSVLSTPKLITSGVPQGSVLSPTLYNIYTHDIPKTTGTVLAQYADDTAILTRSKEPRFITKRLQEAADELEDWFSTWRIDVNASKSAAVFFSRRRIHPATNISMFGEDIPWVPSAKYLGVQLDSRLNWREHITATVNKAKQASGALLPLMCGRSKLSIANKLLLYRAIVRPIMTYAAPIWGYAGAPLIKKLQVVQNKQLRIVACAPWFVRNSQLLTDLHMSTIQDHIFKLASKFFAGVECHDNTTISSLGVDYDEETAMKHKRPKLVLLPH